ncbi:MAG: hypothetical protein KBC00_03260 [Candidatus Levybacteria bacterium]|nr:hypothetical protein [Candidatus Levybacteria bacterium]MBP9815584.1 hypothetical protein [Candidatus Levybacteria bacterium]
MSISSERLSTVLRTALVSGVVISSVGTMKDTPNVHAEDEKNKEPESIMLEDARPELPYKIVVPVTKQVKTDINNLLENFPTHTPGQEGTGVPQIK